MPVGLSPRFPLSFSEFGDFSNITDVRDLVKQNFKNLLLTVPGERIMLPDFGVGLLRYLFELSSGANISSFGNLEANIKSQVSKYLPYIDILGVSTVPSFENEHLLNIRITYFIKPLSITDTIEIIQ